MHGGEINLHRLIKADRGLGMGRTRRQRATPFCVSNLQRRHTYHEKEEREKKKLGLLQEWERKRWQVLMVLAVLGVSVCVRACRGGSAVERRPWGRVERSLARQESDSLLIGSIGHCQRRIFSCSLTGRTVRMIAHLSAQKTNKNKPLLI